MEETKVNALAQVMVAGTATEEEMGIALKSVQNGLSCSLLNNLNELDKTIAGLNELTNKCVARFKNKVDEMLESDTIDHASLFDLINTLQKNQISLLDLQRKIIQSPNKLFSDDNISAEEKKLLTFFKSFKSKEEREKFMHVVNKALNDVNDFDS